MIWFLLVVSLIAVAAYLYGVYTSIARPIPVGTLDFDDRETRQLAIEAAIVQYEEAELGGD
jgi:hypothetical protein